MAPPHAQEEIHGDHGHFVEEIQEEQIQGHEYADGRRGKNQNPDVKLFDPVFDVPGDENAGEEEDAGGQDQRGADSIHPEMKGDPQLS